jgi:hypothetical protein
MVEAIMAVLAGLGMAAALLMSAEMFTALLVGARDVLRAAVYGG